MPLEGVIRMRPLEIIRKKRDGYALSAGEIREIVSGYTAGDIPDYQAAAFLMSVYFRGMDEDETFALTRFMAESGRQLDLAAHFDAVMVDKHSTGGVGDKVTLILVPLVASCGVGVVKMSGRGLGHTGGTIDKLDSIPGFRTSLEIPEIMRVIEATGAAIVAQMPDLVPADGALYSLRDVTGTVESLPLIASSIMSKKLAVGADAVLLDVKAGRAALMPDYESAMELARSMVGIGRRAGKRVAAVVTDMEEPLGFAVGNALEVSEAIEVLEGGGPEDLRRLCVSLAARMLIISGSCSDFPEAERRADGALRSGKALEKFAELIEAQGGDARILEDPALLPHSEWRVAVCSPRDGYVQHLDGRIVGEIAMALGAGREARGGRVDLSAGLVLERKVGDRVARGEVLAVMYPSRAVSERVPMLSEQLKGAYGLGDYPVPERDLIRGTVDSTDCL